MCKIPKSEKPVNQRDHHQPKTWCESCGGDTSHSQKACSLDCAEWLVRDAISRCVTPEELHKYQNRRDRWRKRVGLQIIGRGKPSLHPEARA